MPHYFDDPKIASAPMTIRAMLRGQDVELSTDRGIFSYGSLDLGTRILLDEVAPPPATGNLLDLGCGYGPITVALASASPGAQVWAVDVNSRARELCALNCRALGLDNVEVCAPEQVPAELRFGCIWSNPPIRIGKPALHQLLTDWLDRLEPTGLAALVVQKNLGADSLQAWLNATGWPAERRCSRRAFRILEVRARTTPG